jgi:hypothetical protein
MHTVAIILSLNQSPDIYYLMDSYILAQAYLDCSHNILQNYYFSVPYHLKSNIRPMWLVILNWTGQPILGLISDIILHTKSY